MQRITLQDNTIKKITKAASYYVANLNVIDWLFEKLTSKVTLPFLITQQPKLKDGSRRHRSGLFFINMNYAK